MLNNFLLFLTQLTFGAIFPALLFLVIFRKCQRKGLDAGPIFIGSLKTLIVFSVLLLCILAAFRFQDAPLIASWPAHQISAFAISLFLFCWSVLSMLWCNRTTIKEHSHRNG